MFVQFVHVSEVTQLPKHEHTVQNSNVTRHGITVMFSVSSVASLEVQKNSFVVLFLGLTFIEVADDFSLYGDL